MELLFLWFYLVAFSNVKEVILLAVLLTKDVPERIHSLLHGRVDLSKLATTRRIEFNIVSLPSSILWVMDHLPLCFGLLFLTCHKDYSVSFDLVTHFERGVLARGSFKKSAAENSHLMTCPITIVFDFFCVRCQLALSIAEPALRRTATRFIHIIVDRCFDGFVDDVFSLFRIDFFGLSVYAGHQLFYHH